MENHKTNQYKPIQKCHSSQKTHQVVKRFIVRRVTLLKMVISVNHRGMRKSRFAKRVIQKRLTYYYNKK